MAIADIKPILVVDLDGTLIASDMLYESIWSALSHNVLPTLGAFTLIETAKLNNIDLNRAGFAGGSNSRVGWSIMTKTTNKYSPEVRERAVRMVLEGAG